MEQNERDLLVDLHVRDMIARLVPSAVSIYFDHLDYLSFRLKKSWRTRNSIRERFGRCRTSEESCREKSIRNKVRGRDEKNIEETDAEFRQFAKTSSFPRREKLTK